MSLLINVVALIHQEPALSDLGGLQGSVAFLSISTGSQEFLMYAANSELHPKILKVV